MEHNYDLLTYLDFAGGFCREVRPERGEDSYLRSFCQDSGIVGVFDGCGGLGAQTREYFSGKTEAFMASRMCAGSTADWFHARFPRRRSVTAAAMAQELPAYIDPVLQTFGAPRGSSPALKGSMSRELPTTMAAAVVQSLGEKQVSVSAIWAGDSRVYLLTSKGLAQMTSDDCTQQDPLENLYEDGVLTNLIAADGKYTLHTAELAIRSPFVVLAATDGCFGYVSTPMEFEGILLNTLQKAGSASEWEQLLEQELGALAGDDCALQLAAFGFGSFQALKEAMMYQTDMLKRDFLNPLAALAPEDRDGRRILWSGYRANYLRYLGGV